MTRLSPRDGEWIDRSRSLGFTFEGRSYQGFEGDTISSALYAAGVKVMGRSFKYHRPRSILSMANHDANLIMQDGGGHYAIPNVRADVTALAEGMALRAVNTFGGLESDQARALGRFSNFLPVGFYYKAFSTKRLFPMWERLFRRLTGLGTVDFNTPRLRTPKQYGFCDVLVIGGGPSGIAAAQAAAAQGAEVLIVDENARMGGSLSYQPGRLGTGTPDLSAVPRIRVMTGACAAGYYADHWVPLVDADKMIKMRARAVIVATGVFEQPAVFRNNDLPGIMLAGAAQRLIHRYGVKPMQRAVVLVGNADGYRAALDLVAAGIEVPVLIDLRPDSEAPDLDAELIARRIPVWRGHCVYEAVPSRDGKGVVAVRVAPFNNGLAGAVSQEIPCDGVVMSVGYAPAANLLYQAGASMRFDERLQQFVPDTLPSGVFACGRVNGVHSQVGRVLDGQRAGSRAAAFLGFGDAHDLTPAPAEAVSPSHPWPMVEHPQGKNFVDFDEDLQLKDFRNAVQEGFDNIELLKRFSTNGMGPSQGKHSNMNGLRILARLTGKAPQEVGTTTARPFYHPVPMSHLAGRGFRAERATPLQGRHEHLGAVMMPAGVWHRPEYYARPGVNRIDCIRAEATAVRTGVGIIDVGTLGKLEVTGPDAAEFLERVYISKYAGLKVGMTRYAVMCDEAGVVIDDGVVARLAQDHFYFTTTTSGAATIYRELTRLNTLWGMDCGIVNHTGSFAAVNLAGPLAPRLLAPLTDLDLSASAFPYLAVREGRVVGIPARLMRVGFVGEWGYEIHVPANLGGALWDELLDAGKTLSIRPFGVEAQRLLRLEKGHIIIGQDTDGLTSPLDAALDWAVKFDKPFFVGQRSLQIISRKPQKQLLVGFMLPESYSGNPPAECHLAIHHDAIVGRVTSSAWSPVLQRHIGLAFVAPELSAPGTPLEFRLSDGSLAPAEVTLTPFYDPESRRQKEPL